MPQPKDEENPLDDKVGLMMIRLVVGGVFVAARICAGSVLAPASLVQTSLETADLLIEKVRAG